MTTLCDASVWPRRSATLGALPRKWLMIVLSTWTAVVLAASAPTCVPRARCSANSRPLTTTTSAGLRDACRAAAIVLCRRGSQCSRRNAMLSDRSSTSNHLASTKASNAWSSRGYSQCGFQPAFQMTSESSAAPRPCELAWLRRNQHIRARGARGGSVQYVRAQQPSSGLNPRKAQSNIELRADILAPQIAQSSSGGLEQRREGQQRMGRLCLHLHDQLARRVLIVADQQVGKLTHPFVRGQRTGSEGQNTVLARQSRDDGLDHNGLQDCRGAWIERCPRRIAELGDCIG